MRLHEKIGLKGRAGQLIGMTRIFGLLAAVVCCPYIAKAQIVKLNNTDMQNQLSVMFWGSGNLTPAAYYEVLNNSYYNNAKKHAMILYRALTADETIMQASYVENIKKDLEARAEEELINIADRKVDLVYNGLLANESEKLGSILDKLDFNIGIVTPYSYTTAQFYQKLREQYKAHIDAIHDDDTYLANAERQKAYGEIYLAAVEANKKLAKIIAYYKSQRNWSPSSYVKADKSAIVTSSAARWNASAKNKSTVSGK